jgi:predicted peroxiredoxin
MRTNAVSASRSSERGPTRLARDAYAVILASGPEDAGKRATLALAAACTAQAMDLETIVFLIGDGAHWAYQGHAERVHAPGFPALADLIDSFVEAGGQLLLCSACDGICAQPGLRRRDVRVRGLPSLLSHTVGASAVTF